MDGKAFISRFTPSRTDPEVLDRIFVQREKLRERTVQLLRDSGLTPNKHHFLFVGPRGCGKTNLVSLVVHDLLKNDQLADRIRIAWLSEDESTPSFWKFLLRILRALRVEYPAEFPEPPREELRRVSDDAKAALLVRLLLEKLRDRALLVVVENLDEVLRGLKLEGQKRWRSFLQEHAVAATLATSQQLTDAISDRDEPWFYRHRSSATVVG